jgi:hypothetical protein
MKPIKYHSVSISNSSFQQLHIIRKLLPFRASIPQAIQYITKLGLQQINKELSNDNTSGILKE